MELSFGRFFILATIVLSNSKALDGSWCGFRNLFKTEPAYASEMCDKLLEKRIFYQMWSLKKTCVAQVQKFLEEGVTEEIITLAVEKMNGTDENDFYNIVGLIKSKGWDDNSIKSLFTHVDKYIRTYQSIIDNASRAAKIKMALLNIDAASWKSEEKPLLELNYVDFTTLDYNTINRDIFRKWIRKANNVCDVLVAQRLFEIIARYHKTSFTENVRLEFLEIFCLNTDWHRGNIVWLSVDSCVELTVIYLKTVLKILFVKLPSLRYRRYETDCRWTICDVLAEVEKMYRLDGWKGSESDAERVKEKVELVLGTVVAAKALKVKPTVFWAIAMKTNDEAFNTLRVGRARFYVYFKCLADLLADSAPQFGQIDNYNKYRLIYQVTKYFHHFDEAKVSDPGAERKWTVDKLILQGKKSSWNGLEVRNGLECELNKRGIELPTFKTECFNLQQLVESF